MKEQFIRLAASALKSEPLRLLDIGCSGGIDPVWRTFGPRLQAIAIDSNETECCRLAEQEENPDVSYVAAFVAGSASGPVNPYSGLLTAALGNRLSFSVGNGSAPSSPPPQMADPSKPIVATDLLAERGWDALDYLKIDVDGVDFEILQSFAGRFDTLGVSAVQLEVNFVGAGDPDEHSFHNTDRFMRQQGYSLIKLEPRNYSLKALPARFATTAPAQTERGRIFQGEAYYARDSAGDKAAARSRSAEQLLRLAAIFSAWEQPDSAAEVLREFRMRLASLIDIDHALDLLAAQIQQGELETLAYRDYMAAFERQESRFYPSVREPTFRQRIRAARAAYWDWTYAHQVETARKKPGHTSG